MKTLILCGGKGTRAYPHTTQVPKPLLEVAERPVLEHVMHIYARQGFTSFVLAAGFKIEMIERFAETMPREWDVDVVDTGEDTVVREIAVWEENPEQQFSREELGHILNEAVDSLRPAFRTVFVLRDIEELSTEETAEALGISIPAVKSRLLRARLQLREKLTRFFKRKGDDVFAYL